MTIKEALSRLYESQARGKKAANRIRCNNKYTFSQKGPFITFYRRDTPVCVHLYNYKYNQEVIQLAGKSGPKFHLNSGLCTGRVIVKMLNNNIQWIKRRDA